MAFDLPRDLLELAATAAAATAAFLPLVELFMSMSELENELEYEFEFSTAEELLVSPLLLYSLSSLAYAKLSLLFVEWFEMDELLALLYALVL